MLIQTKFASKGNHFLGWKKVEDVLLEVAGEEKKEIIILTLIADDNEKLKIHLSKSDIEKIKKMLGLINEAI